MNICLIDTVHLQYGGRCSRCSSHTLPASPLAIRSAMHLIRQLDTTRRIDFDVDEPFSLPELSTDYLWTKGPGRMLGVMICSRSPLDVNQPHAFESNPDSIDLTDHVSLKAFSGQMSRHWRVPGWVGPVCGLTHESKVYSDYRQVTDGLSAQVNQWDSLIAEIGASDPSMPLIGLASKERDRLRGLRRMLSHELMGMIQASYLTLDGRRRPLSLLEAYHHHEDAREEPERPPKGPKGSKDSYRRWLSGHEDARVEQEGFDPGEKSMARGLKAPRKVKMRDGFPAGTGDCCAPKLIHACRQMGLIPHSMVEFWYGSPPNTMTRQGRRGLEGSERDHLHAYPPCGKCDTILGSMLCSCSGP